MAFPDLKAVSIRAVQWLTSSCWGSAPRVVDEPVPLIVLSSLLLISSASLPFPCSPHMITLRFRRRDRREDVWCLLLWPFYVVYILLLNVLSAVPDRRPLWYIMSTLFLKFFHKAPHWSFMRAGIFVVVFVFFHCYIPPTHLEHRWAHNKNSVHICWLNGHPKLLRVYVSG